MRNSGYDAYKEQSTQLRRLPIILIYGFLGPLVGGFLFLLGSAVFVLAIEIKRDGLAALSFAEVLPFLASFFLLWIFSIPFSFLFGFVQALLTGLALAEWRMQTGRVTYFDAGLAAFIIGIIACLVLAGPLETSHAFAVSVAIIGILASLILRFVFRAVFAKP